MIRILIVEDEAPISNLMNLSLKKAGYFCDCAYDGEEAAEKIGNGKYDLILLDVMLPKIDGFELMDYIRPLEIPVIFITAKNSVSDRVKGLRMGAEDYIVKPFEVIELLARVDVVLRRYKKTDEVLEVCGLCIDPRSMRVQRDGKDISLTRKEYELLLLFARNPNTALYRETIYERVWGGELEYGSKTVDLHVQRLRKKTGLGRELQAVNKVGYRLEVHE
ncbi:MAG TPA: response regulator transcription factor [Candidatus Fusicatenibacter merdavium]|uniref:Stage 0 sporulation protein A homolog n=1 Tax=Candidatus Fusicatenibacter merdavium TaxID=2838600 RepID=A0A9D1XE32_9FIRM|nr:response regulator transcription factor [Candidatus Fusicatenibacter merdavium]